MADIHKERNHESANAQDRPYLPTRTIYAAVVTVVIGHIFFALTLLFRNPMDEIDSLRNKLDTHIEAADNRMDAIERDHVGFDILLSLPPGIDRNWTHKTDR